VIEQNLDLEELLDEVIAAATAAAEVIQSYGNKEIEVTHKGLGGGLAAEVVTEADLRCQALIETHLKPSCDKYSIAFIGEESKDKSERFNKPYSWLVDPIDGTLPFIEKREGYTVSIGLIDQKGEPLLGVVFNPYNNDMYAATRSGKKIIIATDLSKTMPDKTKKVLTCYFDRSYESDIRYNIVLEQLTEYAKENGYRRGIEVSDRYGAALNACSVLKCQQQGKTAIYLKLPKPKGGSIWDYAASAAIFSSLNLPVSDVFGKPLDLNRKGSTYLNHKGVFYASDDALFKWVLSNQVLVKNFKKKH